jgi:hypothetical protein
MAKGENMNLAKYTEESNSSLNYKLDLVTISLMKLTLLQNCFGFTEFHHPVQILMNMPL